MNSIRGTASPPNRSPLREDESVAKSHLEPAPASRIVCASESQARVLEKLDRVAPTDAEILITGPTGVGKELYARYAHERSHRRDNAFAAINCSNLSSDLIENELFGHARGAYTGAQGAVHGLVSTAARGTLFFDEIDTLSRPCQAKLLRFIQTKEYRRLGDTMLRRADVRFITASNADLASLVRDGSFREDLFFRLRVVPIEVEPLASRRDDIPPLVEHFVARYAEEYRLPPIEIGEAALAFMLEYAWPGNVREVENCIRYLTCLQLERPVRPDDLPLVLGSDPPDDLPDEIIGLPLRDAKARLIADFERLYLERALERSAGNVSAAARASGKDRRAFFELMRKYGMDAAGYRARQSIRS